MDFDETVAAFVRAARQVRTNRVAEWVRTTFGQSTMSVEQRALRFLEEAIELAQAAGISVDAVTKLVSHVYGKPAGVLDQEVGGVALTLLAFCAAAGLSADDCEQTELARVLVLPAEHFRARHNVKAALGLALPTDSADVVDGATDTATDAAQGSESPKFADALHALFALQDSLSESERREVYLLRVTLGNLHAQHVARVARRVPRSSCGVCGGRGLLAPPMGRGQDIPCYGCRA